MELAVWEGRAPADADEAARDLEVLYEFYVTRRWAQEPRPPAEPPTPRVLRFARALNAWFPDDGPEEDDVWAEGPLESAGIGRLMHWSVLSRNYDRVEGPVARLAAQHGLVAFQPMGPDLLTPAAGTPGAPVGPSRTLALWQGPRPVDHEAGHRRFVELYDRYLRPGLSEPPSMRVQRVLREIGRAFPEGGTGAGHPWGPAWSEGPELAAATGPLLYWSVPMDRYDQVKAVVTRLAQRYGLVCHSPGGRVVLTFLKGERLRRLLHGPAADRG